MIDPKFKDVKVGDWIWTIQSGWARTSSFVCPSTRVNPIEVENPNGNTFSYTRDGYRNGYDAYPSAWTYNPFDPEDKPPCEFKKGEVIMATDHNKRAYTPDIWPCRIAWPHIRKLTPEEKGE